MSRFIESAAVVAGAEAFLLSGVLKAPLVAAFMAKARWFHGADVQGTLEAIDRAARAWKASLVLAERENAAPDRAMVPDSRWTVDQAAGYLGLSRRRVQELARAGWFTGRREGRRWVLDEASVLDYNRRERNGSA